MSVLLPKELHSRMSTAFGYELVVCVCVCVSENDEADPRASPDSRDLLSVNVFMVMMMLTMMAVTVSHIH